MADYIYLLENRLSPAQLRALSIIRNAVRASELTLFLTGGAVRDLTGGGSIRDLDFTVQGDATSLRSSLEAAGGMMDGENPDSQTLFFSFPGGVRTEISSAMAVSYPKPGKPEYRPSSIIEDLRRRDFTANAMALSLNEGSYGLLMDPVNGIADIENRELRLVSNYGFIEDPSLLIRATRLCSRLGFHMEERTEQRYNDSKESEAIKAISKYRVAYELEEIFHEEDPLRTIRALDGEGWLQVLSPLLRGLKPNEAAWSDLRDKQGQLQTQGILVDASVLAFSMIVGTIAPGDVATLKSSFARPGFAREIDSIEERTKEFQTKFSSKEAGVPSAAWRILHEAEPSLVLSMYVTAKGGNAPSRLKTFLNESPNARQRIPYATLQEMRITPDLPRYAELMDKLFFELMDGKLATPEELKAYLEPYSPPAPPPTVNLRRARAKKEARPSRAKAKKAATVVEQEESVGVEEGILEAGTLTGPDRGTTSMEDKPLEGTVAPLAEDTAAGHTSEEPATAESPKSRPAARTKGSEAKIVAAEKPAKKLPAKPECMPMKDADKVDLHPAASKSASAKGKISTPQAVAPTKAAAPGTKQSAVKTPEVVKKASAPAGKSEANPGKIDVVAKKAASNPVAPVKPSAKKAPQKTVPAKKSASAPAKAKTVAASSAKSSASKNTPAKPSKAAAKPSIKSAAKPAPAKANAKTPAKR